MQNKKFAAVLGMLAAVLLASGHALAALTVTPITWNVIGLDSNDPASGPRRFPVGARVCSNIATTGINVNFELATANPYVNVRPGSLTGIVIPALTAGACSDAYFEVEVAANPAAYGTTERYRITANDGTGLVSTPVPRELFVERLVSQARNEVSDVKVNGVSIPAGGTMTLMVGSVYDITLVGATATQGYNQLESFINFPNTVFQVLSVATTYSVGGTSDRLYADACGWENNPASPNYRSCVVSDNKAGGSVSTVYTVRIISGGGTSEPLNTLIYDFSGSSYHYNADYGFGARIAQIVNASSLGFAKAFAPAATVAGGTSTLTFTISNPNAGAVTGLNFVDNLPSSPAQMVVATPLTVSTSGCGAGNVTAVAGGTSVSFANGSVAANGSCTVSVRVSVPAAPTSGSYVNTSQPLFVGTTSTGSSASATLNLTTVPPPSLSCGLPLATWTMEPAAGTTSPPAFTTRATDVASATAIAGSGINHDIETTVGFPANSWGAHGWSNSASVVAGDDMTFAVTTTNYTGVLLRFDASRTAQGPQSLQLSYSTDGVTYTNYGGVLSPGTTFTNFAPALPGPANTSGLTYFRISGYNAANSGTQARLYVDNVRVEGCQTALHPTITKAFAPASIPLAGGVSTLTFTLANSNATQLTGVRFTDALPAGVQVASPPVAATTCSGSPTWAPTAGATSLAFGQATGATIPGSGSCTVSVNVTGTTSGAKVNVSGFISSTESGTNTGPTGSATATLTVEPALLPPVAVKSFAPDVIASGGRSMLTITITNPNTLHTLTGVAIADTYPVTLANANPLLPAPVNTCGGTLTALAGGNSLSLSGGSIPPGSNCAIEVPVTSATVGDHVNTTGAVSAAVVGNGNTANATLSVDPAAPVLRLSKQVRVATPPGPWLESVVVAPGAALEYRFVVENVGNVPVSGVTVTDPLLSGAGVSLAACSWAVIPVASPADDPTVTCTAGTLTAAAGLVTNTATAQGNYAAAPVVSPPDQATYFGAVPGLSLTKQIGLSATGPWLPSLTVSAGTNVFYRFTIANNGNTTFTGVSISDPSPAVDESQCTYVDPLPPGGVSVCTLGPVAAGGAGGSTTTNTATASGTDGGGSVTTPPSSASYTIQLISADVSLVKTLVTAGPFTVGQSIAYTLQVANAGPSTATNVQVTDTPTNLTITGVSGGGCAALPCTIASLASGASVTINVTATINAAGAFDNSATATATETDPNPANNTDSTGNGGTAGALADVSLVKNLVTAGPFTVGQSIAYTLQVANAGPSTATNVQVTDTPSNLTITGVSGGGCAALPCTIASLASGASVTINVTATINAAGAFDNAATALATETDPNLANNTDNSGNGGTAGALADVSLVKTLVTTGPFTIGQSVAYTLEVGNAGPSTATSVQVTDTPTNLTITGVSGGGCTALPCTIPSLVSGASVTINVTATIDAAGAFDNAATALATETDPNLANNTDNSGNGGAAGAVADLSITKTNGASSVVPGGTTTYLVVVANAGPSPASGASVVDSLPVAITVASWTAVGANGATCPASGAGSINATVNLPVGGSCTFTIVATISAGASGTLANTATVTPPAGVTDPVLANNSATDSDPIVPTPVVADLSVTKTDGVGTVIAGGTTTYAIVVANAGPDAAPIATLTDTLPAQATFNSLAAPAGWSCVTPAVGATGTITCSNASFASGGSATFTLVVTVGAATPSGTTLTNTAVVASGASDPTPGNNTATDVDTVTASADLSVVKSNGVNGVTSGAPTTYTVTVTNNGPSTVTGAILADPAVAGLTKTAVACAVPPGACVSAPTVGQLEAGFALPVLASGATYRIAVTANVTAASGNVSNTATVAPPAGVTDPTPGNNSSTDTDPVTPAAVNADLSVTKTDGVATVVAGTTTSYTIVVANAGPDAAPNATLSDTLPAQVTFVSLAAPGGWSCTTPAVGSTGTVSCSNPSLASGASASFTLVVAVGAATPAGTTVTNTATVSSGASDPTPGNNAATDTDTVTSSADLSVVKSNGVAGVTFGFPTTYTVTVTNAGPSTVTGAILVDPAVAGLTKTAVACAAPPGACVSAPTVGQLEAGFALPVLASGATYSITVAANVTATTGNVSNTATVTPPAGVTDPAPGNNSSTDTDPVTPVTPPIADMSVTKTDGVTTVTAGTTTTYTIVVANAGPIAAPVATMTDTLPAQATFVSLTAAAGWMCTTPPVGSTGTVTCNFPAFSGSATFTLVIAIDPATPAGTTLTNTANVSSGLADPTPGNNTATDVDTVTASADLSVVKSNGVNGVTSGTPTTYTVTVTNAGPSAVTGAILADPAVAGLTKTAVACAAPPGACVSAPTVGQLEAGFALPALASGATYRITVTANVTATSGNVSNTATVTPPAGVTDPTPGNNSSTDTDPVTPPSTVADLTIVKTNNVTQLVPGGTVIYTLVVTNLGPGEVTGATVSDPAPAGLSFGAWTCSVANPGSGGSVTTACVTGSGVGNVVATVDMKVGAVLTFAVPATVSTGATGTIVNNASVAPPPGITDPVNNNNAASEIDPVGAGPAEIPTLSEWALVLLSLMVAMLGLRARRAGAR